MVLSVNNCLKCIWLLTVKMFQWSITIHVQDGYSLSKPLKFTIEIATFSSIFHQSRAIGLKVSTFTLTVPPAVSTLTEQTMTTGKNLQSAINMNNLVLKYIPQDTVLQEHVLDAKSTIFCFCPQQR